MGGRRRWRGWTAATERQSIRPICTVQCCGLARGTSAEILVQGPSPMSTLVPGSQLRHCRVHSVHARTCFAGLPDPDAPCPVTIWDTTSKQLPHTETVSHLHKSAQQDTSIPSLTHFAPPLPTTPLHPSTTKSKPWRRPSGRATSRPRPASKTSSGCKSSPLRPLLGSVSC